MTTLTQHYTPEQLAKIDLKRVPRHIAIIPDGNRRWAQKNQCLPSAGHKAGCERVLNLFTAAKELAIERITLYTFSTENWKRPQEEIDIVMNLLLSYLQEKTSRMIEENIRLHTIGDLTKLPEEIQKQIVITKKATQNCSSIHFVLALNYGGRDEITRAIHRIINDYESKRIVLDDISEELISQYLDTQWIDPALLIRTSGEQRISNFLLWQISYAEIYTTPVLWPDFSPDDLLEAIISYQRRDTRHGA